MSINAIAGVALVLLGGILNGSFIVPMKRMSAWRWENTWLLYSAIAQLFLPWIFAVATVPRWSDVLHQATWSQLVLVSLFGLGWGVGSILFGLGVNRVGMALGFAVILGVTASVGSLLPLMALHPYQLLSRRGYVLMAGMLIVIFGVALCSIAGRRREREASTLLPTVTRSTFFLGLLICIFSGVFSAMLNFSFVFGTELQQLSLSLGARLATSANLIWSVALSAGFVANAGYCIYLLQRNRAWHLFAAPTVSARYWLGTVVMGLLWFGGIAAYGMGAATLGSLGGYVGWPIFMSTVIIVGNVWGVLMGEWAGASRSAYAFAWMGIAVLMLSICVISILGAT